MSNLQYFELIQTNVLLKLVEIYSCSQSTVDASYQCYRVSVRSDMEPRALTCQSQLTVPLAPLFHFDNTDIHNNIIV